MTVAGPDAACALGPDYVEAVGKVIRSHVRNELAGAAAFDEPAIALAPGPKEKWLACRIAMEEYGHHLKFARLAADLGLDSANGGRTLSVFDYGLSSWAEFVVLKAIVDLAEVVLMEELLETSYVPLRDLVTKLLPEEHFHVSFGTAHARDLASDPERRPALQQAVDDLATFTVPFFGRSVSANNEAFRRWGVKQRTNDEARAEWAERARHVVEDQLGLRFPEVDLELERLSALARSTPAGDLSLPLAVVGLAEGVQAAGNVDLAWLAAVDGQRTARRDALVAAGREPEMEAALRLALQEATERLDPVDDGDVDAHVASGAQLWLLAGAVVSALLGEPDPFAAWGRLVAEGWWPIGPSGGRLVVCDRAGR